MLTVGVTSTPAGRRFIGSAQSFHRQFHALESAPTIGSIERLVLSLAMTG